MRTSCGLSHSMVRDGRPEGHKNVPGLVFLRDHRSRLRIPPAAHQQLRFRRSRRLPRRLRLFSIIPVVRRSCARHRFAASNISQSLTGSAVFVTFRNRLTWCRGTGLQAAEYARCSTFTSRNIRSLLIVAAVRSAPTRQSAIFFLRRTWPRFTATFLR